MSRGLFAFLLVALLVAPYTILISVSPGHGFAWPASAPSVIGFTFFQAVLSAIAALVAGAIGACGLLACRRSRAFFEAAALALNAVPVLFVITGVLNLWPSLSGLWGIVLLHALLNSGVVAVSLSRLWLEKIGGLSELAWVEGASRFQFLQSVIGVLARDLQLTALFVFVVCWTSFAVPLVIGGSRATTFEVLIYQNIQSFSTWSQALWLSLSQAIFIFLLSWPLKRSELRSASRHATLPHLEWRAGLVLVMVPALALLGSFFQGLLRGFELLQLQFATGELVEPLFASFGVALVTGALTLILLLALSFVFPEDRLRKFFVGYVSPGAVLSGFALLVLWRATGASTLFKMAIGLSLLFLPAFYRLRWDQLLSGLGGQVSVARTMGASRSLIFFDLIAPQVWPNACRLAGLAAVWAWGDFALSSVVAERSVTLALIARSLLSSYRLENSVALTWVILLGAFFTYLIFEGLSHVTRSRS